ncbi:MAG: VOC family protein [Kangiellaceae bacterium]
MNNSKSESMNKNKINLNSIGQIAIAVSNLDKAVAFYRDILDLPLLFEVPPNLAFFQCGTTRLMLTTLQGEEKDHHTSAIYYQVKDINQVAAVLENRGVAFERKPQLAAKMDDHDLWIGFIRDPDDNLVGLMEEIPNKKA